MTKDYFEPGCGNLVWRHRKENGVLVPLDVENWISPLSHQVLGYDDDVTLNKRARRVFKMTQTKARKKAGMI